MSGRAWFGLAAGMLSLTVLISGCDSPSGSAADPPGTVSVVASTSVYGDIARHIAGGKASVTSIISKPNADPHSFQADTRNQLQLSRADVVVENGGGYDDFVDTMLKSVKRLKSTKSGTVRVLNVMRISGRTAPAGGEFNEHLWYDFPTIGKLADQLADALSAADPAGAATFRANAATFRQKLQRLEDTEASIRASITASTGSADAGAGVAVTEPVPLYLLEACGLVNKTPDEFTQAIEEGTDVSASVLRKTLDLFAHKEVVLLAYNEQTAGPETLEVLHSARANNIPVVRVTETLPEGKDYLGWMTGNLSAVEAALR